MVVMVLIVMHHYSHLYYYRYNIPDKYHRCLYDKDNYAHCRYLHPVNREMHNHELFANFREFFDEFFDTWLPVLIPVVFCYPDESMFHMVFHLWLFNKSMIRSDLNQTLTFKKMATFHFTTIFYGQCIIIKWIGTFRIRIGMTYPTFYTRYYFQ